MVENILFLTGKLAEKSLNKILYEVQSNPKTIPFNFQVQQVGVSVAALMTPKLISLRLKQVVDVDKIIIPGLCHGDLTPLVAQYGIPVERGPEDLKDLPKYFGQDSIKNDLNAYDVNIFAEIVDAPFLRIEDIVKKAQYYQLQGANVIDLGCLPSVPFPHLADSVKALKSLNFKVSIDSFNTDDLLTGGQSGADYLLSLTENTLWVANEVDSIPILIPSKPHSLESLYRAIEICIKTSKDFIADPILDPIHYGLTNSIVRFQKLRKKYPEIKIMMGVGNLTELTDADTTGINALLFGIISELGLNAVLVTSVSSHAVNAIAEADIARRIMFASKKDGRLPRGYSNGLLGLHDRHPFPYSESEIQEIAALIKDPSFRIQVSEEGMHIYNRDGLHKSIDPFVLYPKLNVEKDASHAFYLGVELARAQIAWQLKKRYIQDQEIDWGISNPLMISVRKKNKHREISIKEQQDKDNKS